MESAERYSLIVRYSLPSSKSDAKKFTTCWTEAEKGSTSGWLHQLCHNWNTRLTHRSRPCWEALGLLRRGVENLHSDVTGEVTRAVSPKLGLQDTDLSTTDALLELPDSERLWIPNFAFSSKPLFWPSKEISSAGVLGRLLVSKRTVFLEVERVLWLTQKGCLSKTDTPSWYSFVPWEVQRHFYWIYQKPEELLYLSRY